VEAEAKLMRQLATVFLVVTLLAGCTLGPDYVRPQTPQHPAYHSDTPPGSSIADLPWWEIFSDPTLDDLIRTALDNNRNLRVSLARIEEARARLGVVRADLYPNIFYGANAGYADSTKVDNTTSAAAFADVSYIVDLWGRVRRSNEAALRDLLATEEAYGVVTITLVADVARAYFQLRGIDKRLDIAERTIETRQHSLDIVQVRFDAGMVSEVDVHQARIQLTGAQASVETFKRLRAQTENAISLLLGQPPMSIPRGLPIDDQIFPPEVPAGLPSELVERRPDIRRAEQLLAAQTARIGVAEAARFPSLTLSADLGVSVTNGLDAGFLSLGLDLFGPLFQAGKNKRRVEIEVARTEQLLAQYEQSILAAFREVEDAMVAVETFRAEHEILLTQVASAQAAVDLSWARYEEGITSFLEVLDIERSLFTSRLRATDAQESRYTSIVQLYRALGGGWSVE
jgi:multidrug efflux system outer membrane protein